jgi:Leucine-rich repeat (LRR) protein
MNSIPTDIVNEIQFFLGNNEEIEWLYKMRPEMTRYYFNVIKYKDLENKPKRLVLKLKIQTQTSLDLKQFVNLTYLDCSYCKLTSLPYLPPNVTELKCCFNQLTSLPDLPNVTKLNCGSNKLSYRKFLIDNGARNFTFQS